MRLTKKTIVIAGKRYRIIQKVGEGAYGVVYKALDNKKRGFALKILRPGLALRHINSLKNEFYLLTQLKHPALCTMHEFTYVESLKSYLIVSEFVNGKDFFEVTASKPPAEIEKLAIKVLEALNYLHLHRIIHFDIKCPNILVQPNGQVKLLDFGFARLEGGPKFSAPGTLPYSSPEILFGSDTIDHRTDLYSLGIVLYRSLVRRFPFSCDDPARVINWHKHEVPGWKTMDKKRIPAHLQKLIASLLEKNPLERFSHALTAINWLKLHRENPSKRVALPTHSEGLLIGREKELRLASEVLKNPQGIPIIFTGRPGMGKSRLLKEIKFLAQVREIPYLWVDDLSQRDGVSQIRSQLDLKPIKTPHELFDVSFKKVKEKAPLALIIDDLEEADPLFSEWLLRLMNQGIPLSLFISWKGNLPGDGPLAPLFEKGRLSSLSAWNRSHIRNFLIEITGQTRVPERLVDSIARFSSGIPLLVSAVLHYVRTHPTGKGLPPSIDKLYEEDFSSLGKTQREMLKTLALCANGATLTELSYLLALSVDELTHHLVPLLESELLHREIDPDGRGFRYRVTNLALAKFLKKKLKACLRQKTFHRILKVMEKREGAPMEELATYAMGSGDKKKTTAYLLTLGDSYASSFQTQKAIQSYRELLRWTRMSDKLNARVKERLVPLLVLSGRPDDALKLLPRKNKMEITERKLKGWVLTRIGRFDQAISILLEGMGRGDMKDPAYVQLLNALGNVYVQTKQADQALDLFEQTLPADGALDDERLRFLDNNNRGLALALKGQIGEARHFEKDKLQLFKKKREKHRIASSLSQLGFIELQGHNLNDARDRFEEALALSEEVGDYHNILILLDNLILIAQRLGLYHEAIKYDEKAMDYQTVISPPYQVALSCLKGAMLYLNMGLTDGARRRLERMDSLDIDCLSSDLTGWKDLAWGYYYRGVGRPRQAKALFKRVIQAAQKRSDRELLGWGYYSLADLFVEARQWKASHNAYMEARSLEGQFSDQELKLRMGLIELIFQEKGAIIPEGEFKKAFEQLAQESLSKGMLEVAAEAYSHVSLEKAREIYQDIAGRLPEEYRMAYLDVPFRKRVMNLDKAVCSGKNGEEALVQGLKPYRCR